MNSSTDFEKYQKAKKQVEAIKGFYSHLAFYIVFNGIIIFINLKYSPNVLWFFWTTVSWGLGVLIHAIKVFNWFPVFGKDWEERKIKEYMEKENQSNNQWK